MGLKWRKKTLFKEKTPKFIQLKEKQKLDTSPTILLEENYRCIANFLTEEDRLTIFKMVMNSLEKPSEHIPTCERQLAKLLDVSETIVYHWKRRLINLEKPENSGKILGKTRTPNAENSAKMLQFLMEKNSSFYTFVDLREKILKQIFTAFFRFLDLEKLNSSIDIFNYKKIRVNSVDYFTALTTLLVYQLDLITLPSLPRYSGLIINPKVVEEIIRNNTSYIENSINKLKSLLEDVTKKYEYYKGFNNHK